MKTPPFLLKFLKKLKQILPSLLWSKKDKIPSFFLIFTLIIIFYICFSTFWLSDSDSGIMMLVLTSLWQIILPFFIVFMALVMKWVTKIKYSVSFKIQLIIYLVQLFIILAIGVLFLEHQLNILMAPFIFIALQIILYKKYSKASYILIIGGTILALAIVCCIFVLLGQLL